MKEVIGKAITFPVQLGIAGDRRKAASFGCLPRARRGTLMGRGASASAATVSRPEILRRASALTA